MKLILPQGWEVSDVDAKLILEQILAQLVESQSDITDLTLTHGETDYLRTENMPGNDLLEKILIQLKIMNMHLSILSHEEIDEETL